MPKLFSGVLVSVLFMLVVNGCDDDTAGGNTTPPVVPPVVTTTPLVVTTMQLKKTGQTESYNTDGNKVTNGSVKDDGHYKKGVDANYTRDDAKQIVTDHITGLEWQDNDEANSTEKTWLTQDNYNKCITQTQSDDDVLCKDTQGDTATTYCSTLSLDGSGWRLPRIQELQGIVVDSAYDPSIDTTAFKNYTTSSGYWSATPTYTEASITNKAWVVDFYGEGTDNYPKSESYHVRCVREGAESKKTISLQWQDDYSDNGGETKSALWQGAIDYCEALSLNGHTDWRLPNKKELLSIVDYTKYDPAINPKFTKTALDEHDYWSSTTDASDTFNAWTVSFSLGGTVKSEKSNSGYVRCVR